jgi:hypothetical protein
LASNSVKANRAISTALPPAIENQIFRPGRIILCALTKKPQFPNRVRFGNNSKRWQNRISYHWHCICLTACVVVGMCLGWGNWGEIRRTRPLDLSAERIEHQQRRWRSTAVGLAWRVRVVFAMAIKMMPVLLYLNLLVVTARTAWFNFRGWKKRP